MPRANAVLILAAAAAAAAPLARPFVLLPPEPTSSRLSLSLPREGQAGERERASLDRGGGGAPVPIVSRVVPLGVQLSGSEGAYGDELTATVWEVEHPSRLIEAYWAAGAEDPGGSETPVGKKRSDPFGAVVWPGSMAAAAELGARREAGSGSCGLGSVLVVGAGTGVEAQAAALLGARQVLATDVSGLALDLLRYGVIRAGLNDVVEVERFDMADHSRPMPGGFDLVVFADVLYNDVLSSHVGRRVAELMLRRRRNAGSGKGCLPGVIVTDSQRFHGTDFVPTLNSELERIGGDWGGEVPLQWEERTLPSVTTSGMLVEEDQTYDVAVRILSV